MFEKDQMHLLHQGRCTKVGDLGKNGEEGAAAPPAKLWVKLPREKCYLLSGRGNLGEWSGLAAAERFRAPGCLINPALIITEHGFF